MSLKEFEVVRFKTITKRSHRTPGKNFGVFQNLRAAKGYEFYGVLLNTIGTKENIPDIEEIADIFNSAGWFSGDQLVKFFGKTKAQQFAKALGAEYEKRQVAKVPPALLKKPTKRAAASKKA